MATSTLTSKGQITLPKSVRERAGLRQGDRLTVVNDDQGRVVLTREVEDPLGDLVGLLRHRAHPRPVSVEEMNEAIRARAAEKFGATGKR